jgi:hypothetical protein
VRGAVDQDERAEASRLGERLHRQRLLQCQHHVADGVGFQLLRLFGFPFPIVEEQQAA